MSSERTRPVYVFFSYARQDKALRDKLEDHLSNLKYRGLISTWHDREISAGTEWIQQIDIHLDTADIILLLISSSFMASQYCYSIEMKRALERHEMREARVIPIMLKPVLFTNAPFAKLQFLPTNGKPVVNWRNRDRAFVDIALGIEDVVQGHFASTIEEKLLQLATGSIRLDLLAGAAFKRWRKQTYYKRALAAYEQALHSNPSDVTAYRGKGNALVGLGCYDEAHQAFEQAIALTPQAATYLSVGNVLSKLKRYDESLTAYERAIELDPVFASAYVEMSETLEHIGRIQEAQQAREKAKQLGYEE